MLGLGNSICANDYSGGGPPFSLKLDGTDDFMVVSHNSSIMPTGGLTVSTWVNVDTKHGGTGWINPDSDDSDDHDEYAVGCIASGGYGVYISYAGTATNPTTSIRAILRVSDSGNGTPGYLQPSWGGITTTGTVNPFPLHEIKDFNGWIHIALTYANGVIRLYVNGSNNLNIGDVDTTATQTIDTGVTSNAINYAATLPLVIGADAINAGNESSAHNHMRGGLVDDVAVWSTAIDSDGIAVIYNSGKAGLNLLAASGNYDDQSDLEGWWKFEEGSGTSVADSSSNSNTGTLVNSPSFSDNTSE